MVYSSFPPNLGVGTVPLVQPDLLEGTIVYNIRTITVPNNGGAVKRSVTITPDVTNQAIATYALKEVLTGETITVVSDSTPTAVEVSNLIRAAIKNNTTLSGLFTLNQDGNGTVVATALNSGSNNPQFNFVDNGTTVNSLAFSVTPGSDSSTIGFGKAVLTDGVNYFQANQALSGSIVLAGVSGFDPADITFDPITYQNAGYYSKFPVNCVQKGGVAVFTSTAVDPTKPVYLDYSGAYAGSFRGTSAAGVASQISSGAKWYRAYPAGSIAILEVNLP